MMDVRVLCRSDVASGFRLAGVPVLEAEDAGEARARVEALRAGGETGMLLVQDELYDVLPRFDGPPLLVPFPGPRWRAVDESDRVIEILRRAIGYRVRL